MNINQQDNTEDVYLRIIIAALGHFLNKKFQITQTVNGNKKVIDVPFFYAVSLNERFLQDFFTPILSFCNPIAEGNIDRVPRGSFSITSASINTTSIGNDSVRSLYDKIEDREIKTYSGNVTFLPINLQFDCKIITNSYIESFKLWENILTFYKTSTVLAQYKNYSSIPIRIQIPEDITQNTTFEFTYGDSVNLELPFSLEVFSIIPILTNKNTERLKSNSVEKIDLNISL